MDQPAQLKRTPLFERHTSHGARMVDFSGWEMPVQYTSILDEARAVRSRVGIFDVSHMGRVEVRGPAAGQFLSRVYSVDVANMRIRRARYGLICNEQGGIIDDCILYRQGEQRYLLVPNASNTEAVLGWLSRWAPLPRPASFEDITPKTAMLALQGPQAADLLRDLTPADIDSLKAFSAVETYVAGIDTFLGRTGYTGEDGFELIVPSDKAAAAWGRLVERGATPAGLGARDVLRLEAGLLLHGNDMDADTDPYEAGLSRFVDPDHDGYVAAEALKRVREEGVRRVLVGFNMVGRGIARHGHRIMNTRRRIGHVSSGGYSPTLDRNIGLGYVPTGFSALGTRFSVDIRGRPVEAEVVSLPFYSRKKST